MSYSTIDVILRSADAEMSAAEAHGIATGMLCVDEKVDAVNWLTELFQNTVQVGEEQEETLVNLFEQTKALMNKDDFSFDLFLPDEDAGVNEQVEALCHWCQGFLSGVGFAGSDAEWKGESGEVLRDIIEITKLDPEVGGEEDEAAYVEICEYLRAAVQLVKAELSSGTLNSSVKH